MKFLWRFLGALLLLSVLVVLLTVALKMTGHQAMIDQAMAYFLNLQFRLPVIVSTGYLMVVVSIASVVVSALAITLTVTFLAARHAQLKSASEGELSAIRRELEQSYERHLGDFQQFAHMESLFSERLDKRFLLQSIIESASRLTSSPQADSAVSLWLLNFANDTFDFEKGMYCDETQFMKASFETTEQPFAKVVSTKEIIALPKIDEQLGLLKDNKLSQLGAVTSGMVVPLVLENTVLGVLLIFCHPDFQQVYLQRKAFYDVALNQLTLGLAIAIQGELATIDRLTGVQNREYFMKRFAEEVDRSNRYSLSMAVLMIDIDDFKAVNDTLGHLQGDAVLRIVSKLIKSAVRAIDLVGRYGGEEFIVLLPETGFVQSGNDVPEPSEVAERVRRAVEEEFLGMQKPLQISVSIGVVVRRFPEDRQMDPRELIRLADEQLYRAKTSGKNQVCLLKPEPQAQGTNPPNPASSGQQA